MIDIMFSIYTKKDNKSAVALEEKCVQGTSLIIKYRRPTFQARSEVYDKYKIICAKVNKRLVGIGAWAEKSVRLRGKKIRTAYLYDVRVHPDYRNKGVSIHLAKKIFEDIGQNQDCIYTLVAGENERCLKPAQRLFGMRLALPLTYVVIPVYKKLPEKENYFFTNARIVHESYLEYNPEKDFLPEFKEKKLLGYVESLVLGKAKQQGCSIWTNEDLLAEQVVSVPLKFQLQRILTSPLRGFLRIPYIPKPTDTIPSWFLFDFFAQDENGVHSLLATVNNLAFKQKRKLIYLLLQNNDPTLSFIRKSGYRIFTFPYYFLAKGRMTPAPTEKIYLDIRDI